MVRCSPRTAVRGRTPAIRFLPERPPSASSDMASSSPARSAKQGSDFALDLEHRAIDNYAVVNAVTLNISGSPCRHCSQCPHATKPLGRRGPRGLATRQPQQPRQLPSPPTSTSSATLGSVARCWPKPGTTATNTTTSCASWISRRCLSAWCNEARLSCGGTDRMPRPRRTAPQISRCWKFHQRRIQLGRTTASRVQPGSG